MTTESEIALNATTVLAAYLNAAMASDAMARMEYAQLHGCEWNPLGDGTCIDDGATTTCATVR